MSSLRCADLARREGLSPAGTAVSQQGFALVQAKGPWPRDVTELLDGHPSVEIWRENAIRPQLVVPVARDATSVVTFERGSGPFAGFQSKSQERVVLICCHGVRDVCCGSKGTRVAAVLERHPPRSAHVLRTSHLGGHRFAPTALVLPEGTMWAFVDAELLAGVVDRAIPVESAIPHYRGCAGFDSPEVQVADGGVLRLEGWHWLDEPREGFVISRRGETAEVEMRSASRSYRVLVVVKRVVRIADCGAPSGPDDPARPEYDVLAVEPVGA